MSGITDTVSQTVSQAMSNFSLPVVALALAAAFIALGFFAGSVQGRLTVPIWICALLFAAFAAAFYLHGKGVINLGGVGEALKNLEDSMKSSYAGV